MALLHLFLFALLAASVWSVTVEDGTAGPLTTARARDIAAREIQAHSTLRRALFDASLESRPSLQRMGHQVEHLDRHVPTSIRSQERHGTRAFQQKFLGVPVRHIDIISLTDAGNIAHSLTLPRTFHVSFEDIPAGSHNVTLRGSYAGDSFYAQFESGIAPDIHFPCDRVQDVHFLGASHAELHLQLFDFPSCFLGDFSFFGVSGSDSIEIMEDIQTVGQLTFDVHAFSTRATIPCGTTVISATPISAGPTPTMCTGTQGIDIRAPEISVMTDLSTEDGDIALLATGTYWRLHRRPLRRRLSPDFRCRELGNRQHCSCSIYCGSL